MGDLKNKAIQDHYLVLATLIARESGGVTQLSDGGRGDVKLSCAAPPSGRHASAMTDGQGRWLARDAILFAAAEPEEAFPFMMEEPWPLLTSDSAQDLPLLFTLVIVRSSML